MVSRWDHFGTSIFTKMAEISAETGSLSMAQGFPDFDGPEEIKEAAARAMRDGFNQYAPAPGLLSLRERIADRMQRTSGLQYDPKAEITVVSGATEGLWCAIQSVLAPGDELLSFAPCYDSYRPACFASGATLRTVPLLPPDFRPPLDRLKAAITPKTKAILINSPHNPTGMVFTASELEAIAVLVLQRDLIMITDEVYEEIVFGSVRHQSIAALPGMRERTIVISSTSKTFSMTGWKVGYTFAPAALTKSIRAIHQFTVFCSAHPLQVAMVKAFELPGKYYEDLRKGYEERRTLMQQVLRDSGFAPNNPEGSYFMLGDFSRHSQSPDVEFAEEVARRVKVATIPVSVFYEDTPKEQVPNLLRFAFCKSPAVIQEAGRRLKALS